MHKTKLFKNIISYSNEVFLPLRIKTLYNENPNQHKILKFKK